MLKESIRIGKTDYFLYITIVDSLWVVCYCEVDNTGKGEMILKMPPLIMAQNSTIEKATETINQIIHKLQTGNEPKQST